MKLMKSVSAYTVVLLLILNIGMVGFIACSGRNSSENSTEVNDQQTGTEQAENRQGQSGGSANANKAVKRIEKPEKTLVFGDDEEPAEQNDSRLAAVSAEKIIEASAVLRRNTGFVEQSGAMAQYPVDLVIGKLASHRTSGSMAPENDAQEVHGLGMRFLEAALSGRIDQLQDLSSTSARKVLPTQLEKWETEDVQITEVRIGEIQWDSAVARFDFRIISLQGRAAGSAVCVFEDGQWRVQAVECDCSMLRIQYKPVEYRGFPENYGYFQY